MAERASSRTMGRRESGVVSLEFALLLMFGLLPLLLLSYTAVMVLAAQQSLSLASAEGARAAVLYGSDAQRRSAACAAASRSMRWLLDFGGGSPDCSAPAVPASLGATVAVSMPEPCAGNAGARCIRVVTRFDHDAHPFIPGVGRVYGWMLGHTMASTAIAQVDAGID